MSTDQGQTIPKGWFGFRVACRSAQKKASIRLCPRGCTPAHSGWQQGATPACTTARCARRPTTFFRTFQRFYATRGGFHSGLSAKRALRLLLVVYLFTPRATDGQTPLEAILPEARRMPLYRLINDPFRALQGRESVKPAATMAALLVPEAAAA
jgi:hypothetical protein